MTRQFLRLAAAAALLLAGATLLPATAHAQGTAFSYQGALTESGVPATGTYAMEFRLFDQDAGGTQVGPLLSYSAIPVTNGIFRANPDFGSAPFDGSIRWLQVTINGSTITPRTPLLSTPYAVRAAIVPWAGIVGIPADLADGDQVNDADADPSNELNTSLSLSGNLLQLTDAGGTLSVDLSPFDQRLTQTIVVRPGQSIQAAIDSITDASATKPYLVKLEPGLWNEKVTLKGFVDLEGSGIDRSIVTYTGGTVGPNTNASAVTVEVPADANIRFLTVDSTSTVAYASAVRVATGAPTLFQVKMTASGGTFANYPIVIRSGATVDGCTVTSSGVFARGVYHAGSGLLRLQDSVISASTTSDGFGVEVTAGSLIADNCSVSMTGGSNGHGLGIGSSQAISVSDCTISVASVVARGVYQTGAATTRITNCEVKGTSTGNNSFGFLATNGSASLHGSSFTGEGSPANNYGVWASNNVSLGIDSCSIVTNGTGSGGSALRGEAGGTVALRMKNTDVIANTTNGAAATFANVNASITGCRFVGQAYGFAVNSGIVEVQGSELVGATSSLYNFASASIKVATSKVSGPVVGSMTCFSAYNGDYSALNATCQ